MDKVKNVIGEVKIKPKHLIIAAGVLVGLGMIGFIVTGIMNKSNEKTTQKYEITVTTGDKLDVKLNTKDGHKMKEESGVLFFTKEKNEEKKTPEVKSDKKLTEEEKKKLEEEKKVKETKKESYIAYMTWMTEKSYKSTFDSFHKDKSAKIEKINGEDVLFFTAEDDGGLMYVGLSKPKELKTGVIVISYSSFDTVKDVLSHIDIDLVKNK